MKGIIAVLPLFIRGKGICSQIYYEEAIVNDDRSCENFLKNLCDRNNISKRMMRKNVSELIKSKRNLPWIINQNHVFFPVAFKKSQFREMRRAYINCNYVKEIKGNDIILLTEETISTIQKEESLNENLVLANYLMYRLRYENLRSFIMEGKILPSLLKTNDKIIL